MTFNIKKCIVKQLLFEKPPVNRRMTAKEFADELEDAKIWHRHPRTHIFDKPCYPWVQENPRYMVNFDLNPPQ